MTHMDAHAAIAAANRPDRRRALLLALLVIGFFVAAQSIRPLLFELDAFARFYRAHPWQVGESIWKGLWIITALVGVMAVHRVGVRDGLRELGLLRPAGLALATALVAALPMVVGFALFLPLDPSVSLLPVWMTGVVSPVSEEVLFRGFLFRQLYERARWPFWAAAAMNVVPFVWGHLHQADGSGWQSLALVILITGSGAALFAWLLVRWHYNLWFVIGLHSAMNLAWYLFAVDSSAIGGAWANVARLGTIALAVVLTLRRDRIDRLRERAADSSAIPAA